MSPHDEGAPKEQQVIEGCELADEIADRHPNMEMGKLTIADTEYAVSYRDGRYYVKASDLFHNTSVEVPFEGEDDAMKAFAALIACDEPDLTDRLAAIADKFAGYIA